MRKVELKVTSGDKNDTKAVSITVESRGPGGGWNRMESRDATVNHDTVSFNLRPGQRLVLETAPEQNLVYDRDQAAAVNPAFQRGEGTRADSPSDKPNSADAKILQQSKERQEKEAKAMGLNPKASTIGERVPETSSSAANTKPGTSGKILDAGHPGSSDAAGTKSSGHTSSGTSPAARTDDNKQTSAPAGAKSEG